MADIHIGAFRQPELKRLLLEAFEQAIDRCVEEGVAFVVMSGDIFDSNIPDLSSVRRATLKMKEAADRGVRFYVVYGSHDFSPTYASIVDVLEGAGLFTLLGRVREEAGQLELDFVVDPSGVKLCGISGKKLSIDIDDFKRLDREHLESEPGFKIFVFHGALEEMKPPGLEQMKAMPVGFLPPGFNYYAGGHVHDRSLKSFPRRQNVAFPGPLFATEYAELVQLAHGGQRGFYLVDFDDEVTKVKFIPIKTCEVSEVSYSARGKSSGQVSDELMAIARQTNVKNQVVLLTVHGELGSGKTSDIDFVAIRKQLMATGPLLVLSNYSRLSSPDLAGSALAPKPPHATERELFQRQIAGAKSEEKKLLGEHGVSLSLELLKAMKEDRNENENKGEYQRRIEKNGLQVLGLQVDE
jgi:DNA repair exonuclease SbcCD nuclease subunit